MSMNMVDKVRQHCEMIPDFCVHQIIECVSDQVGTGPEVTAKRVEARGSYVMVALNFLLMDQIYPPDVAYCFVPFLARELCKLTLPEDSDFKPLENVNHIYLVVEDGVSSIRHGKQEEETNIKFKRGIHGLLSEKEIDDLAYPLRTIAFDLSEGVRFCCNNQPQQQSTQGPPNGPPRSPGQARYPNHPRSAPLPG